MRRYRPPLSRRPHLNEAGGGFGDPAQPSVAMQFKRAVEVHLIKVIMSWFRSDFKTVWHPDRHICSY